MKHKFFNTFGLGITIALTAMSSLSSAAEYYKWVDSKGTTHYTKTPPPATAKKKAKVETYGWKSPEQPTINPNDNVTPPEYSEAAERAKKAAEAALRAAEASQVAPDPN